MNFVEIIEELTGYKTTFSIDKLDLPNIFVRFEDGLGHSQFNEILVSMGYHRVSEDFFQFLCDQTSLYKQDTKLKSLEEFEQGVHFFKMLAIFAFGNIQFAFRELSSENGVINYWVEKALTPISDSIFLNRHKPVYSINEIRGEDTYYLGYIIEDKINKLRQEKPNDEGVKRIIEKREEIIKKGKRNYESYLTSEHLDVYIATSMREKHEYYLVNKWVNEIFNNEIIKDHNIRWFDPTQAYCNNRIDKGLFEGLMLKRANCTVYFVQESDTIGKDSELASTLAQGKPVIAFIPEVTKEYVKDLLEKLLEFEDDKVESEILLNQLRVFSPNAAWEDKEIMSWCKEPQNMDKEKAKEKLFQVMLKHYDKRAEVIKKIHPLGIQVNISTGVANGVLVVRSLSDCAHLIFRILTRSMEFTLRKEEEGGNKYYYLEENISKCVYRVVSGDPLLTKSFWCYYLND